LQPFILPPCSDNDFFAFLHRFGGILGERRGDGASAKGNRSEKNGTGLQHDILPDWRLSRQQ
jgi:hypothetical protein